jgi:hypothetical protein
MRTGRKLLRNGTVAALALLVGLGGGAAIYWKATAAERADGRKVQALLMQISDNYVPENSAKVDELAGMGVRAYPELKRILSWRETAVSRAYERLWEKSPRFLLDRLPLPGVRRTLQVKATGVVVELGPAACRAVTGAVADYLMQPRNNAGALFPLRILYWSIPESPKATQALRKWLTRWETENHLFGMVWSYELWPRIPELAPMLTNWLKNPDVVAEAAASLGALGTNAIFAVPVLTEVADRGVIGTNTTPQILNLSVDILAWNKISAMRALGAIGKRNDKMFGVLERSLKSEDLELRLAALIAMGKLGYKVDEPLQTALNDFLPGRNYQTKEYAKEIGNLGPAARAALPWLNKLTDAEFVRDLPVVKKGTRDRPVSAEELRAAAIVAICRIEPEETPKWLPDLVGQSKGNWETIGFLLEADSNHEEIVRLVEPLLSEKDLITQMMGACVALKHSPKHMKAREILEQARASSDPEIKLTAAVYWARAGADIGTLIPVLREGLVMEGDHPQIALNTVELMGARVMEIVPELKECLQSKNGGARDWAGRILRRVAPEEMPPIDEN